MLFEEPRHRLSCANGAESPVVHGLERVDTLHNHRTRYRNETQLLVQLIVADLVGILDRDWNSSHHPSLRAYSQRSFRCHLRLNETGFPFTEILSITNKGKYLLNWPIDMNRVVTSKDRYPSYGSSKRLTARALNPEDIRRSRWQRQVLVTLAA